MTGVPTFMETCQNPSCLMAMWGFQLVKQPESESCSANDKNSTLNQPGEGVRFIWSTKFHHQSAHDKNRPLNFSRDLSKNRRVTMNWCTEAMDSITSSGWSPGVDQPRKNLKHIPLWHVACSFLLAKAKKHNTNRCFLKHSWTILNLMICNDLVFQHCKPYISWCFQVFRRWSPNEAWTPSRLGRSGYKIIESHGFFCGAFLFWSPQPSSICS